MQIVHAFAHKSLKKEVKGSPKAILTNRSGSYFFWEDSPTTRYSGLHWYDVSARRMFKIIECIRLKGRSGTTQMIHNIHTLRKHAKENVETIFLPSASSSLIYTLDAPSEIELSLDIKESFDNREWGRHYQCWEERGCVVVEFVKRTNNREDQSHDQEEYHIYLAVCGHRSFAKSMEWVPREYESDKARSSPPFMRYVIRPGTMKGKKFIFSVSHSKDAAIKEALGMAKKHAQMVKKEERALQALMGQKDVARVLASKQINEATKMAFLCALASLDKLIVHNKKARFLFAGLPWFFQSWSRDSLVSLKAVWILHPSLAKETLINYLNDIRDDGRLPNVSGSAIGSADAIGWLFVRALGKKIDDKLLKRAVTKAAEGLLNRHTEDGLEVNASQETWMDTVFNDDGRKGKRIEIQALRLAVLRAAHVMTRNGKYRLKEQAMKEKVRKVFWNGKILADGENDWTPRPNQFIAAYAYPDLLSKKEWEACFENALSKLWLPWGGLSTIDASHPFFQKNHTGANNASYHRGDSWFWMNNLAALVMQRTNGQKFSKHIEKIIAASTQEILWQGAIGHHAEVSSASQLRSEGCQSQAWSDAMFVELVIEMAKR